MKVLVTGGTGFSGKALVKRLLEEGHQVVALDYQEGHKTDEIRQWGAEVVIGSVTDPETARRCVQGAEVVQHLAAAFRELNVSDDYYHEVNVGGTRTMLEAAQAADVKKFIYCSTCGVHGNIDHPPGDETAPIHAADYYQQTKYEAEPVVAEFFQKGLKTVIIRPAAIYGPGDPERFQMIFKRVNQGVFPMFGSGETLYHPLYIDNLVDAFMLAMEPGKGEGQAYLIADKEYLSIKRLVQLTAEALEVKVNIPHLPLMPLRAAGYLCEKICRPLKINPPIFPRRVDWYRQNRAFNIGKAQRDLGYAPKVGIEEGLRRTAQWYRAEGYLN
ncbi:MAG: NAD-dependent epimerase/dehydratase family protein [Desulfobacterales bacterium]